MIMETATYTVHRTVWSTAETNEAAAASPPVGTCSRRSATDDTRKCCGLRERVRGGCVEHRVHLHMFAGIWLRLMLFTVPAQVSPYAG